MKQLVIDESKAKDVYKATSDAGFKQTLEETFGKAFFSEKIIDRIKTFEDACKAIGVNPKSVFTSDDSKDERAYKKLKVIAKALNEGWEPDWNNSNECKYYPWFQYKTGFGFSYTHCDGWYAGTVVGSRLCFKTDDLAIYAGKQFEETYNDFLTL